MFHKNQRGNKKHSRPFHEKKSYYKKVYALKQIREGQINLKQTYVLKTKELLCETLKKKYDFYYNLAVKNVTEKKYTVSRLTVLFKKCVLKNFAKLTGKNLIRRVFFNIFQY